ncbi:MAG TPA: hypothetical protein VHH36_04640 [Candidatus Thermoplasmatota archaeon]|nr:hypothetical protein [Candidatus Thermoplasmatota archaeon]
MKPALFAVLALAALPLPPSAHAVPDRPAWNAVVTISWAYDPFVERGGAPVLAASPGTVCDELRSSWSSRTHAVHWTRCRSATAPPAQASAPCNTPLSAVGATAEYAGPDAPNRPRITTLSSCVGSAYVYARADARFPVGHVPPQWWVPSPVAHDGLHCEAEEERADGKLASLAWKATCVLAPAQSAEGVGEAFELPGRIVVQGA